MHPTVVLFYLTVAVHRTYHYGISSKLSDDRPAYYFEYYSYFLFLSSCCLMSAGSCSIIFFCRSSDMICELLNSIPASSKNIGTTKPSYLAGNGKNYHEAGLI